MRRLRAAELTGPVGLPPYDHRMATERSPDAVDSPLGATFRFLAEVAAWVAAPWAAARVSVVLAVLVLVVLLALPAVFNVPGDKHTRVLRAVSGRVRIGIELLLFAAAVVGATFAWPEWAAVAVLLVVLIAAVTNQRRWRWLVAPRP
jgi:hypothetical protein